MAETASHKRAKRMAAGPKGSTEVALADGRRVDAMTKIKATNVQRLMGINLINVGQRDNHPPYGRGQQ